MAKNLGIWEKRVQQGPVLRAAAGRRGLRPADKGERCAEHSPHPDRKDGERSPWQPLGHGAGDHEGHLGVGACGHGHRTRQPALQTGALHQDGPGGGQQEELERMVCCAPDGGRSGECSVQIVRIFFINPRPACHETEKGGEGERDPDRTVKGCHPARIA
jgi:hypothetical protein